EVVHGGKEEIRDRLAGGRGSGDRPELGIVGSGKRERLVERRRATALALGEAAKRRGQVVQRVAQAKRQATIRSTAMTMTGPSPSAVARRPTRASRRSASAQAGASLATRGAWRTGRAAAGSCRVLRTAAGGSTGSPQRRQSDRAPRDRPAPRTRRRRSSSCRVRPWPRAA